MATVGREAMAELSPGTEVEVRTRYEGRWVSGFQVDAVQSDRSQRRDHYLLRRRSDGVVLPVVFHAGEIRPKA